jgi:hypothetical protein
LPLFNTVRVLSVNRAKNVAGLAREGYSMGHAMPSSDERR